MNQQTFFNKTEIYVNTLKKPSHKKAITHLETVLNKKNKEKSFHHKNSESKKKYFQTLSETTKATKENQHQPTRPLTPLSPSFDCFDNILDNTNISDYSDSHSKSNGKIDYNSSTSSSSQVILTINCNDNCFRTNSENLIITKKAKQNIKHSKHVNSNSYLRLNDCLSPSPSPTPSSSSITCGINFLNNVKFKGNFLSKLISK